MGEYETFNFEASGSSPEWLRHKNLTGRVKMNTWAFEIIDKDTHQVLVTDKGFISESEAEYYAHLDIKLHNIKNYYLRTFPEKE